MSFPALPALVLTYLASLFGCATLDESNSEAPGEGPHVVWDLGPGEGDPEGQGDDRPTEQREDTPEDPEGTPEEPEDTRREPPGVDLQRLTTGSWYWILEGSTGQFVQWHTFSEPDRMEFTEENRPYWEAPSTLGQRSDGRFSAAADGTVSFEFTTNEGLVLQRRASTFVVLEPEVTAALYASGEGAPTLWSGQGYALQSEDGRRYRRVRSWEWAIDGELDFLEGLVTDLTFAVPPTEVDASDGCQITLSITAEALNRSDEIDTATETFDVLCSIEPYEETGLSAIWVQGIERGEGWALQRAWSDYLLSLGLYERVPDHVYRVMVEAFSPLLLFDPDNPSVLFHHTNTDCCGERVGMVWEPAGVPALAESGS